MKEQISNVLSQFDISYMLPRRNKQINASKIDCIVQFVPKRYWIFLVLQFLIKKEHRMEDKVLFILLIHQLLPTYLPTYLNAYQSINIQNPHGFVGCLHVVSTFLALYSSTSYCPVVRVFRCNDFISTHITSQSLERG